MTEFDVPLSLTTPHTRGQNVKDAQWLLAGHNVFSKNNPIHPYQGAIDGEYGLATYSATKHAKYWLGYPSSAIDGRFGPIIYQLLHGDMQLTDAYNASRNQRIADNQIPLKLKALHIAESQVGIKENPTDSNMQKYGLWYGMNGVPWCAIFVSYCLFSSGFRLLNGNPWKYSYVPSIDGDAALGRNRMSHTKFPEPGDLVCYNFGHADEHVGFFKEWRDNNHYYFNAVEGNTGAVNFSNGGEVLQQERSVSLVSNFVRLT